MAKLFALFILIVMGLFFVEKSFLSDNMANMWSASTTTKQVDGSWTTEGISGMALMLAFGTAIIGSLFSSDAWNNVTYIAGEIKDPRRNIPLSLLLGTVVVTLLYVSANIAYLNLLPLNGDPNGTDVVSRGIMFAQSDRVGASAGFQLFGDNAAGLMSGLIMISTFGCASGLILSGARVYYAMAQKGLFLKQAAELNEHAVPANALWMQAVWASLLCLSGTYGDLLDYCTFVSLIFYAVTIAGLLKLRRTDPDAERPYRVPLFPFTPIVYIILATAICLILLYTKTFNTGMGLLIVALGAPFYYLSKRNTAK